MRRGSVKKLSNFKLQAEKNVFRDFLDNVEQCKTAVLYPTMKDSIKTTSQVVFQSCYSYNDDSAFVKGLNYGGRNYGFSSQPGSIVMYKQWLPNIKQAYIYGDFNNFDKQSHKLSLEQGETEIYEIEIDLQKQKLVEESRVMLRLIDNLGEQFLMAPPSCQARSGQFGVFCLDLAIPKYKHSKKQQILLAYTLDLKQICLQKAESWIQQNMKELLNFNTLIIRNLFQFDSVLDKSCLQISRMKQLYDLINTIKDKLGFKIILEWVFTSSYQNAPKNPLQQSLLKKNPENGKWTLNLENKQVVGFYLSRLSFYLSTFLIDGFHFKQIDSIFHSEHGQILLKFINLMHNRLLDNSFVLASCKKEIPGINQPILDGGLGFTYTYNYNQDFLTSESHKDLKQKFDSIMGSSNCVPIDLSKLNKKHFLNFIFAVIASQKGIFCKGDLKENSDILHKILRIRKQYELFNTSAKIISMNDKSIYLRRGRTQIIFNFSNDPIEVQLTEIEGSLQILFSSDDSSVIKGNSIGLMANSCSILEEIFEQ